ncbi:MAG: TIGR02186 family protein [Mesorhizobium sp.]|nr:TIGR02186 family protein [Mesorhizobium sp.]
MARRAIIPLLLTSLLGAPMPSLAQETIPESIQIGLSTDRVTITSDFSGAALTIFGAVDNPDPQISRQGGYDVIVVLEGPSAPVVVWRRARVLGVWVNAQSETFVNIPVSYSVATTKVLQDIAGQTSYRQLSLGASYLYLEPENREGDPARITEFTAALRARKLETGLYSENVGGVQFLSQTLFRATLNLPPNVPVGTHKARAFLFRGGVFIKETSANLAIVKAGFEQTVYRAAHDYSLLYGIFAVVLAMLVGWLGRIIFRRD